MSVQELVEHSHKYVSETKWHGWCVLKTKIQSIFWNAYRFIYLKGTKIYQKISWLFPVLFYLLKERNNSSNHRKIWYEDIKNNKYSLKCLEDFPVNSIECFCGWVFSNVIRAESLLSRMSLWGRCAGNTLDLSPESAAATLQSCVLQCWCRVLVFPEISHL